MTIEDQLRGLGDAAHADPACPPDGTELWRRGKRWQRRRTLGAAGAAALALVLLLGLGWGGGAPLPGRVEAAQQGKGVALPRVLWANTSPYLGELERGPVVAVATATRRGWGGERMALLAISATTGEYGFLDLPFWVFDGATTPVPSPDGRYIAYPASGMTGEQGVVASGAREPVAQVRVLDTRTGETAVHAFDTRYGLMQVDLRWVSNDTLTASPWPWQDTRGEARLGTSISWRQGSAPVEIARRRSVTDAPERGPDGRALVLDRDGLLLVGDGDPVARGKRILATEQVSEVLSWRGDTGVVSSPVPEGAPRGAGRPTSLVRLLNPDTGALAPFLEVRAQQTDSTTTNAWAFASGLLADAPVVDGVEPPRPRNPWLRAGGAALVLLLVGGGHVFWRRRVRP